MENIQFKYYSNAHKDQVGPDLSCKVIMHFGTEVENKLKEQDRDQIDT